MRPQTHVRTRAGQVMVNGGFDEGRRKQDKRCAQVFCVARRNQWPVVNHPRCQMKGHLYIAPECSITAHLYTADQFLNAFLC